MLDQILDVAAARAERTQASLDELVAKASIQPKARSLASALRTSGMSVIAEIKRRSPSAGVIDDTLMPGEQAVRYADGGADAISVLTEPEFFGGSIEDLQSVRSSVDLPVLRKDFTVSEAQIWEARAAGADAILLIVAALDDPKLARLVETAGAVGVDAIVEAHSKEEVVRAVAAGADIIGVNNRDLRTFQTNLSVAEDAASVLPTDVVRIAESGVSSVEGAARMRDAGYDAILVGEALVRHQHPQLFVAELKGLS